MADWNRLQATLDSCIATGHEIARLEALNRRRRVVRYVVLFVFGFVLGLLSRAFGSPLIP